MTRSLSDLRRPVRIKTQTLNRMEGQSVLEERVCRIARARPTSDPPPWAHPSPGLRRPSAVGGGRYRQIH